MTEIDNSVATVASQPQSQRAIVPETAEAPFGEDCVSSFARANELFMSTARAIYTTQMDAVRAQAEDAMQIWRPLASGDNQMDAITAASEQIFTGAERLYGSTQKVGGLVRDFGWQFSTLCAENALQLSKQLRSALPNALASHA